MKPKVKVIVSLVISVATLVVVLATIRVESSHWKELALWVALGLAGELFWLRTPTGDSVHTLATLTKLTAVLIFPLPEALVVIFVTTMIGNAVFRRTRWYRAWYNSGQSTLAGLMASLTYTALGGEPFQGTLQHSEYSHAAIVSDTLINRHFLSAFLLSAVVMNLTNYGLMTWLMSSMTQRRPWLIFKENCLYPEELRSTLALILMVPLLIMLYGSLGLLGVVILFVCLALVHQANRRHLAITGTQDNLIRSERMAAMGEMAEEIGRSLGNHLDELKRRSHRLFDLTHGEDQEMAHKSAEIIGQNVDHMAALVEGLAAFSHRETQRVPTDMNTLIARTVDFVRPQNRFDNVEFRVEADPILPPVSVDPAQMQQVFINLLANAADAMADQDNARRIFIETRYAPDDQRIRITLTDTGPGIPQDNLHRVFEPHFTTKPTGHGFGLATVFRIASNHKGSVTAANVPNMGARFVIDLPNS